MPSRTSPLHTGAVAPSVGTMLLRGCGWGAALGGVAGFVLPAVTVLMMDRDLADAGTSLLLGFLTGPIGLLFGAVAGVVVAVCCVPVARTRHPALAARAIAAVVGPVVVVSSTLAVFRPRFEIGPNETRDHVVETVLVFVALPAAAAHAAALAFAHRLVRPTPSPPHPTQNSDRTSRSAQQAETISGDG